MQNKTFVKFICMLQVLFLLTLSGCSANSGAEDTEGLTPVYYIGNDETKTEAYYVEINAENADEEIAALLDALATKDPKARYKAPLAMGFTIQDMKLEDGYLTLDMSIEYKKLVFTTEVLVRAAIVRTLCTSQYVQAVCFTVDGKPLKDHSGFEVGWMDAGTFISNDGNEINTYEEADIMLYFASADGNSLISVYRNKFYSTSMPLERFVVDELISGPSAGVEGLYPSVNPSVSVLSISTKDRVCYVNLSSDLLIPYGNVPTAVSVYAITDSLCNLPNVDKVQILVDGVVPEILESSYEANDSMVITLDEALQIQADMLGE
ncbi:MAG: GerMN domain-containing protein [Lachnospiraceae bacterium]|nr:GerMN domain-containing protein [Lachnospiraceae bacterium]